MAMNSTATQHTTHTAPRIDLLDPRPIECFSCQLAIVPGQSYVTWDDCSFETWDGRTEHHTDHGRPYCPDCADVALKPSDRVTITGHSPASVGTVDSLNVEGWPADWALVKIDGLGYSMVPLDLLERTH